VQAAAAGALPPAAGRSRPHSVPGAGHALAAQYLRQRQGQRADWNLEQLQELYGAIHEVNQRLADRLREASLADANVNSVALLDVLAYTVDFAFEAHLQKLLPLFADHLDAAP
jgi:hypothetical protein